MHVCGRQQIPLWLLHWQIRKRHAFNSDSFLDCTQSYFENCTQFAHSLASLHTCKNTHTHTRIFLRNIDFFPSSSSGLLMRTSIFVNKSVCLCQSLCSNARSGFVSDSCRLSPGSKNHWQLRSLLAFAC